MADDPVEVPLGDMIETLRQELEAAQKKGRGQGIAFEIEKVELELQIVVSRKSKGDGKIAFWVLSAGGELERAGETTHKFKLSLSPKSRSGEPIQVSGTTTQDPTRQG
jgi:hypothetical protein